MPVPGHRDFTLSPDAAAWISRSPPVSFFTDWPELSFPARGPLPDQTFEAPGFTGAFRVPSHLLPRR